MGLNIKDLTMEELTDLMKGLGIPGYRARQIYSWMYQKNVCDWESMTNLPQDLRRALKERQISLGCLNVAAKEEAPDGTVKYLFELADGHTVESIFLPEDHRYTICFSTQVGCSMGCRFCATGQNGLQRNLTVAEIVDQPLRVSRLSGVTMTNLVAMGQGEPLLNYESLMKGIRILNHPEGLGLGARRITISTCGIVPGILKLARETLQVNLAVSLHAANDGLRGDLMPIARKYPLMELMAACKTYLEETGRRITFEYTLMNGVNDRPDDLANLIRLLRGMLCHVNLIPFNPVPGEPFTRSPLPVVRRFAEELNRSHVEATIRKERGTALTAACGQLQGKAFNEGKYI